jgi:hypothetical protein
MDDRELARDSAIEYTPKMSPPLLPKKPDRIPAEIKREVFLIKGISMKTWAEARGFNVCGNGSSPKPTEC